MKKAFLLSFIFSLFLHSFACPPIIKPGEVKNIGKDLKVKTVVIDAGHGGKDPGCHGDLYKEKDIALSVALKLGKYIEDNFKDVKVIFTRKTDVFVELNERAAIANRNNADLFICVHCNSACVYDKKTHKDICNEDAHGSETYVMGPSKDAGNLEITKRENKSILLEDDYKKNYDGFDPTSDEANILFTMYQNVFRNQSLSLASKIQECYKQKAGRNDKGVQQAGFLVLWKTAMPSLLTEIGFLTNHKEEKFLGSEKGQSFMASSIFRAFRLYKNEVEGTTVKYNDEFEKAEPYNAEKEEKAEKAEKKARELAEKEAIKAEDKQDSGSSKTVLPKEEKKESTPDDKYNKHNYAPGHGNEETKAGEGSEQVLVYKVIFYASDKKLGMDDPKFDGINQIECYEEGGRFKYTSGAFEKMNDAAKCQNELRKKGYKDAFVTGFRNGKRVK
ncbi:MAG: N-acetylmuramoyl-L-alanine amidase [Bacteroidia bacterium]